jgi:uncharacterized protein
MTQEEIPCSTLKHELRRRAAQALILDRAINYQPIESGNRMTEQAISEIKAGGAKSRVLGIDVARGIALLGIFFVNAQLFAQPFGAIFQPFSPHAEGWLSVAAYWFTNIFCAGKFYPLFSLLFGAGLAMMYQSAVDQGRSFGWTYFRRLVLLGLIGILHIVLLWYGDILLVYASIAVLMIWMGRFQARKLLIIGGSVFLFGLLLMVPVFALLNASGGNLGEVVEKPMPEGNTSLQQFFRVVPDWNETEVFDSRLIELERRIMSEGPYIAAIAVRLFNYLFSVVFIVMVLFWVILPCFCVGAALMKSGFFHGQHKTWRTRLIWMGLLIGIPLAAFSAWSTTFLNQPWLLIAGTVGSTIGGPLMALMYLSSILNWAESDHLPGLAQWFSRLGKMALTGYLLESLLMCAVMQHWGLARFGNNTWAERFALVIGIYLVILIFANIWMSFFRQGPMEYVWRRFTYLGRS